MNNLCFETEQLSFRVFVQVTRQQQPALGGNLMNGQRAKFKVVSRKFYSNAFPEFQTITKSKGKKENQLLAELIHYTMP